MIEVNREELIRAMQRCAVIAPLKHTTPMVTHALIELAGKSLRYRSTDLVRSVSGTIDARGEAAWFCVRPREFADILATLPGERLKIQHGSGFVKLTGEGKRTFKVRTLPPEEYPADLFEETESVQLPVSFLSIAQRVVHAAAQNDDREWLKAVHFFVRGAALVAFALDGKRAAEASAPAGDWKLTEPVSAATLKMLGDWAPDSDLWLSVHGNSQRFAWKDSELTVLRPGGSLPEMPDAFDLPNEHRVSIQSAPLVDAIGAVQLADDARDVTLSFGKSLVIEANGNGYGRDEIDVECPAPCSLTVNAKQLTEALRAGGETVELCYSLDSMRPIVLRAENWNACLMPILPSHVEGKAKL